MHGGAIKICPEHAQNNTSLANYKLFDRKKSQINKFQMTLSPFFPLVSLYLAIIL